MKRWHSGIVCLVMVLVGMTGAAQVRADGYKVQEAPAVDATTNDVQMDGTVTQADADRDRVIFRGDDGRRYTLDTSRADINLPGTDRPGQTADLAVGIRIHIDGTTVSDDIIQANRVRVLSRAAAPARPLPPVSTGDDTSDGIDLCGTVESVDQSRRSFVVHINDHSRTVFLDDTTDLPQTDHDGSDRVPLHRGDRVTVTGILRPDGTVLADRVRLGRPGDTDRRSGSDARQLVGRVTQTSGRDTSRDITVRVASDQEMTVHVPNGTPITRDGQPISVHDLTTDDVVRVSGTEDGDAFRADRITVVRTYGDNG